MRACRLPLLVLVILSTQVATGFAQPLGVPDRASPGDQAIQEYLGQLATRNFGQFADDLKALGEWQARRPRYRDEYFYMLGLHPMPERTPLKATVTGTLSGDGYVVENLHYQSRPGLYVTGNLYRPATTEAGQRLPAVFYVCGHSARGRDGNKTAYQSHGIWFARHGYVCLVVDTLQLGEIAAIHHGTYNQNRWWWHSRGYTSAGVECWNGVRGIDYLISRPDVDPERIAVTGISGGGAATFWIAAADERVKVAVPVSGMADLLAYVPNRVINGHCDCMFLYNTFDWPWTRIAGLIAPRPLLFVNSDQDAIFPMDGNDRVINQLERLYSLYGAGDKVDAVVSVGGHAYRQDIRQAVYRFINIWLKNDASPVTDSEVDLVVDEGGKKVFPIDPVKLRVFPQDTDLPRDQLNTTIDEHFVPSPEIRIPSNPEFAAWQKGMIAELRRVAFRTLPNRVPLASEIDSSAAHSVMLETEPGIRVTLNKPRNPIGKPARVVLTVVEADEFPTKGTSTSADDLVYEFQPRGFGPSRWTVKNPPNYVARSHVLLGRTVDAGRVHDVIATARYLRQSHSGVPVVVSGEGEAALIAAYAALWEPDIAGVIAINPSPTHMDSQAPQFLNILRVADAPAVIGLLAPRPLELVTSDNRFQQTTAIYSAAGATEKLKMSHVK